VGMGFGIMLFGVIFWVAIIALVLWALVRVLPGLQQQGLGRDPAEEVVRQRFARGEIDAEDYERSLEVLRRESTWRDHENYGDFARAAREQRK
jgi:putative membrane protein